MMERAPELAFAYGIPHAPAPHRRPPKRARPRPRPRPRPVLSRDADPPRAADADAPALRGFDLLRSDLRALARLWAPASFDEYDPALIARYYAAHPLPVLARIVQLALPAAQWTLHFALRKSQHRPLAPSAEALPRTLASMGPIFVKIGQALSSRPDLIADDAFLANLRTLQDAVAPMDDAAALRAIEAELPAPLHDTFDTISRTAVASASLGQVYRARLRDTGEDVAVKVQRPRVREQAGIDLLLLRVLAGYARKRAGLRSDLPAILDEFARGVFDELDYVCEAAHCDRFRHLYGALDGVVVPRTYPELTTRRVLVIEWLEGEKAGHWGPDAIDLIEVGIQCTLQQLLDGGFFHADPHPANLKRVVGADGQVRLGFIDFGMMSEVSPARQVSLIKAIVHFINRDFRLLADDLIALEFLPDDDGTNMDQLADLLKTAFGYSTRDKGVTNLSFGRLTTGFATVARQMNLRLPPYYALIVRTLTILEGIALEVDPAFRIVDQAYPFVAKRFLTDPRPELRDALTEVLLEADTKRIRWSRLVTLLERSALSGGPPLQLHDGLPSLDAVELVLGYILSQDAVVIRSLLEDELVDIIDDSQLIAAEWLSDRTRGLFPAPVDSPDYGRIENLRSVVRAVVAQVTARGRTPASAPTSSSAELGSGRGLDELDAVLSRGRPLVQELVEYARTEAGPLARRVTGKLVDRAAHRVWQQTLQFVERTVLTSADTLD